MEERIVPFCSVEVFEMQKDVFEVFTQTHSKRLRDNNHAILLLTYRRHIHIHRCECVECFWHGFNYIHYISLHQYRIQNRWRICCFFFKSISWSEDRFSHEMHRTIDQVTLCIYCSFYIFFFCEKPIVKLCHPMEQYWISVPISFRI